MLISQQIWFIIYLSEGKEDIMIHIPDMIGWEKDHFSTYSINKWNLGVLLQATTPQLHSKLERK